MKRRKVPMRKCVVSQQTLPKNELIRIVRSPEGNISIDLTGKKSGRGAYLSKDAQVIQTAKQQNSLERHLKGTVDPSIYDELLEIIENERFKRS